MISDLYIFHWAIPTAKAAADAGAGGEKGLGAGGEPVEKGMDELGPQPGLGALFHLPAGLAGPDLPGDLGEAFFGPAELFPYDCIGFQLASQHVIVGHRQGIGAIHGKVLVQQLHGVARVFPAGAYPIPESRLPLQPLGKFRHGLGRPPGVDGKYQAHRLPRRWRFPSWVHQIHRGVSQQRR